MKWCWTVNFILTDAKRRSIWIVYCSRTVHVHLNKTQQLFYHIKTIFRLKSVSFSRLNIKFWLTFLRKPCDITTLRHKSCDIIQLLTFAEVDTKFYWPVNYILTDANIWIFYCSIKLHVHRNKSQQLFYYIKSLFQFKGLSFCRLDVKFWLTLLHKPCDISTLRHRLCDYLIWFDFPFIALQHI